MKEENEIIHEYTDEIVCPHCGYEFLDSYEYFQEDDSDLIDCPECDESFYAIRQVSVTYSTEKPNYGTCTKCNKENQILEDYHGSLGIISNQCLKCKEESLKELQKEYMDKLDSLNDKDTHIISNGYGTWEVL